MSVYELEDTTCDKDEHEGQCPECLSVTLEGHHGLDSEILRWSCWKCGGYNERHFTNCCAPDPDFNHDNPE
jgi:ribosomal protein S27AE